MHQQRVVIHNECEIAGIRAAAAAAARVRDRLGNRIVPGMSTLDVDCAAAELIAETGGRSAFLGYRGFPRQICISLNDEVVHGMGRADRIIGPADLVSIDVGVVLNGFVGDTAKTVSVGTVPPAARRLLDTTQESLAAGIAVARVGHYVNAIGVAVEATVGAAGFAVVRDFVGHGCGRDLHEPPEVPNFAQRQRGPRLQSGMVLAIEPMVNAGTGQVVVDADRWTVRSRDGSLSAHFEHMILITRNEPEILTWPKTASK